MDNHIPAHHDLLARHILLNIPSGNAHWNREDSDNEGAGIGHRHRTWCNPAALQYPQDRIHKMVLKIRIHHLIRPAADSGYGSESGIHQG